MHYTVNTSTPSPFRSMSAAYDELLQRVDHMEKRVASETATRRDSCDTGADFDADILGKLRLLLEKREEAAASVPRCPAAPRRVETVAATRTRARFRAVARPTRCLRLPSRCCGRREATCQSQSQVRFAGQGSSFGTLNRKWCPTHHVQERRPSFSRRDFERSVRSAACVNTRKYSIVGRCMLFHLRYDRPGMVGISLGIQCAHSHLQDLISGRLPCVARADRPMPRLLTVLNSVFGHVGWGRASCGKLVAGARPYRGREAACFSRLHARGGTAGAAAAAGGG